MESTSVFSRVRVGLLLCLSFAGSAWAYDTSSYVQDGLIAHWDGIENDGCLAAHNPSATQWTDLKHGYAFDLKGVTIGESYLYFSGSSSSYAQLNETNSAAAFPGASNTVEICLAYDGTGTEQTVLKGPSGSNAAYGNHRDNGDWVMNHNYRKAYCFNSVGFAGTNTVALSYARDNFDANLFYYNGETRREVLGKTSWFGQVGSTPNANAWLGVNQAKGNAFKGKIYAVRVYNRVLTAEEVQKNCVIDKCRFCSRADWSAAEIAPQAYDGLNPCRPSLAVTDNETTKKMTLGTDYTVTYEDNAAPGTGYAVVQPLAPHKSEPIRVSFAVRLADAVRRTCVWTNTVTSSAQAWNVATSWKDLDDDGTGDVPRPGDDVLVSAAASINFAGAHVGTLKHTAGALTVDCGNGVFTNGTALISTGASVTLQNGTIYLPYGEYVLSNTCTVTHKQVSKVPAYFKGPGSLMKKGGGTITYAGDALDLYQFTGPLTVKGGTFQTQGYNTASFYGPHEIIVDGGYLNICKANQLNMMHTVRILNRGTVNITGSHFLHRLFINGQGCAIGTWGAAAASGVDHKTVRITSGSWVYPLCGPATDPFAPGPVLVWSGETRHWAGTVSTAWKTAANWEENLVPSSYDDIVIPAGTPYKPAIPSENGIEVTFHTLSTAQDIATQGWRLTLTGDLHLNGATFTTYPVIYFNAGAHVIDGSGTLKLNWHNSLACAFGGDGNIIKRGTGSVESYNAGVPYAHKGFLRVEGGSFKLKNSGDTMPNCTNIVVTGAGSLFQVSAALLQPNTTVTIADGGQVSLNGTFTNTICKLYVNGYSKGDGHTYGSPTSVAERKLSAFAGKGALLPTADDHIPGAVLRVR